MNKLYFVGIVLACCTLRAMAQTNQTTVYWYYCDSAHGYAPYVKSCPEPWRAVIATPNSAPRKPPSRPAEPLVTCALGEVPAAKIVTLTPSECQRQNAKLKADAQEREAQQRKIAEANAAAERQKADEERRRRIEAIAAQLESDRAQGYKVISFEDFELDGKEMADSQQMVIIQGAYIRVGQADWLMPRAVPLEAMAQLGLLDQRIGLLLEDAPREVRRLLLECRRSPAGMLMGCMVRIAGHVTMCGHYDSTDTSIIPCISVEGTRYVIN